MHEGNSERQGQTQWNCSIAGQPSRWRPLKINVRANGYARPMDLSWIWAATAATAAALTSIWSGVQAFQSRTAYSRYEQWIRIRDDHPESSPICDYASARSRENLIDLGSRSQVLRLRRRQWAAIIVLILLLLPALLFASQNSPNWVGVFGGGAITLIILFGDWRVSRTKRLVSTAMFGARETGPSSSSVIQKVETD